MTPEKTAYEIVADYIDPADAVKALHPLCYLADSMELSGELVDRLLEPIQARCDSASPTPEDQMLHAALCTVLSFLDGAAPADRKRQRRLIAEEKERASLPPVHSPECAAADGPFCVCRSS